MKQYLVWINIGGENGYWQCEQYYYKICTGDTEEEIIKDWLDQSELSGIDFSSCKKQDNQWYSYGRSITIFELKKNFLPEDNKWKTLVWS